MTDKHDPIEMRGDAREDARKGFMEKFIRPMRAEVVSQPLLGEKVSKDDRRRRFRQLRNDPAELQSQIDFLVERYKVPQGMVPRALWECLTSGERVFGEEGEA